MGAVVGVVGVDAPAALQQCVATAVHQREPVAAPTANTTVPVPLTVPRTTCATPVVAGEAAVVRRNIVVADCTSVTAGVMRRVSQDLSLVVLALHVIVISLVAKSSAINCLLVGRTKCLRGHGGW